ncbi:autotransporter outer membrane beta-barrel domain-containing protein [Hydrogenophaga sp. 2FB]|uniref:autotransporter family protein n=1 Tax=Hydrogenophaga sp. 2FB TaxID=2502187 RepID=UPI0010F7A2B0|nr:autotransporter outer membrane beta-barrel domain-containing protein [Hydrogenophaga sp. 2FB]
MNPRYTALALATWTACGVSQAATFSVTNETELISAINAANASGDPTSTINLTTGFTITTALPPVQGNVTINPNGFAMALESVGGASLVLRSGASYGTLGNFNVGNTAGTTGAFTVQGVGTHARVTLLQGLAGQVNIRVLDGGVLASTGPSGIRFGGALPATSSGGVADVLVSGTGSALTSAVSYIHQRGTLEVSGGGKLEARLVIHLGSMPGGFTGVVTGAGSSIGTTFGGIALGASGTATLRVSDGALLSANGGTQALNLAANAGGSATLNIGAAAGDAAIAPGTVLASVVNGGAGTAVLNFNHNASAYDFTAPITGSITLNHLGSGTTTLRGASTYAGATTISGGTLRAGAANVFSANSAHTVAAGGALDLGSFDQTLSTLSNAGTVSLSGATLTMTGAYVGNGGTMNLGVGPTGAPLVFAGPAASATGTTQLQISNLGGLGSLTTGDGIEVISATGGATTTAQTTRDAFSLPGGQVGGGAYAYSLHAGDASGAGENWYLRSTGYRSEASLYAVVPEQFRSLDFAMLGDRQQRIGEPRAAQDAAGGGERQAWGRIFNVDRDIAQQGTVSPTSSGRIRGFQTGTDLWGGAQWRTGVYVGKLESDMKVNGFASGEVNYAAGRNVLSSRYLGGYATWLPSDGLYVDGVLQVADHGYTAYASTGLASRGTGDSLVASVEVGKALALAPRWVLEPQLQLAYQRVSLDDNTISNASVQQDIDAGWIARVGARIKGRWDVGPGPLQLYGGLNLYKRSSGTDITRFVGTGGSTDISSRTGGTSSELALGASWRVSARTSLYGELGKLWDMGGDARTRSGVSGSLGVKLLW